MTHNQMTYTKGLQYLFLQNDAVPCICLFISTASEESNFLWKNTKLKFLHLNLKVNVMKCNVNFVSFLWITLGLTTR